MKEPKAVARVIFASWLVAGFVALGPTPLRAETDAGPTCVSCHDAAAASHAKGKHAKLGCATCHGGTPAHLANPGPETRPSKPDAGTCQACHVKDARRMNWEFADHAKAGLSCTDCHGNHAPKGAKGVDAAA
ncbi:MAG: cytochrome c family protein, partial [Elusimicrobia bacterium]